MRIARLASLLILVIFAGSATARQAATSTQQTTVSAPQATALLQQSLAALSGGHAISDVTLSGAVQGIEGSDDESGMVILKAVAAGASSVSLNLTSGKRSEIQNCSTMPPSGAWSGPDGVSHAIVDHNLHTGPSWFFPIFTIAQGLSAPGYVATYIGHETRNGQAIEHVSISQPIASSFDPTGLFQHLSQVEIYLDSGTLVVLPAKTGHLS